MSKPHNTAEHQIFLQMRLNKALERDPDGNVIFTIEASNENLDIEQQRVLQSALLETKDYFLKSGVVSKDHKHRKYNKDGTFEINEDYIIGEPLDVYTRGTSTLIKGKLYTKNGYAQKFIKLLDQGSSRVRASVGGLFPRVKQVIENGKKIGNVVSVLWDDLALTTQPVNPTVGFGTSTLAKSLSSIEFVKALSAGSGTDAAEFAGGRALQKEEVEHGKTPLSENVNEEVIAALVGAIADGDITDPDEAESFLADYGLSREDARDVVRAVLNKSNSFMEVFPMAGFSWDEIKDNLKKSFSGKKTEEEEKGKPDPKNGEGTGNEGDEGKDEYEDAGPIVKALSEKVTGIQETMEAMAKAQVAIIEQLEQSASLQKSLGEGILAVMERTEEVKEKLATPDPRKSVVTQLETALAKSLGIGAVAGTVDSGAAPGARLKPFTPASFDKVKDILIKAVSDGEIDVYTCGKWETQINKSMGKAVFPFTEDFVAFMKKKAAA